MNTMITSKKIRFVIPALLLSISSLHAAPNQSTGSVTIKSVSNWGAGGDETLLIRTNEATINPALCGFPGEYFLKAETSDISRAMVLGAKLNNTPITFVIYGNGCSDSDRPTIVNVSLPEN